jgi:hypothetical protein
MARFLNLIQDRAPSTAPGLDHDHASLPEWGRSVGVALVVASSALRLLSDLRLLGGNHRPRSVARNASIAFAAGAFLGLAAPPVIRSMLRSPTRVRAAVDDAIDRDSVDSFPASDAPQRGR